MSRGRCLFQASSGGDPQIYAPNGCQTVCNRYLVNFFKYSTDAIFQGQNALNLFFDRGNELQIYHGNILNGQ